MDTIDKRDFDAHRPPAHDIDGTPVRSGSGALRRSAGGDDEDDEETGLLTDVVENIVERDRRKMQREVVRVSSFAWGVISCLGAGSITTFSLYGPLFLSRLHYSQFRVNWVAIAAEIALYLPVPIFGYLCDRYSPSPLSLLSAILFGAGYLLAAFTYSMGPPVDAGGQGWPFWVMLVAFVAIGAGTCAMYIAAVTTCAKNFGRGTNKGIMLAVPIAAFGLSGMWQSQVGTYVLCERSVDGARGEVDVFRYFVFLAVLLFTIGVIGTFGLRIVVDEDKYIDETVDELERSGLLEESEFFRPARGEAADAYGTFAQAQEEDEDDHLSVTLSEAGCCHRGREKTERRRKDWLLNYETRLFLKDHTMWWLALGFFLVTGPGEAYINNLGTVIQSLTPRGSLSTTPPAGLPSTHVTTIALTSTIARLVTGSLSDIFAPPATHHFPIYPDDPAMATTTPTTSTTTTTRPTFSRLLFLIPSAILLSLGFLLLASPIPLHHPGTFHVTTALVGLGYGSAFSLVPIVISVVWGVENFGTNWGIVAMAPAAGAAVWGLVYSRGFQDAASNAPDGLCRGWSCYGVWAVGCTFSVWLAVVMWLFAWAGWRRRGVVV
ncbi:hypothetical protein ASPZODRAFT_57313 [Penicilliopsis zonata CBS 506.65]|uniref:Probable transporter MCH1 n=1 Tax=Penicilliopsis zonata CBS 506.65 TaxID=1073090 RepID=A0A1L9SV11_9EURO|nr:hypothetical protein ASPZODRAFT_57313 [Penicilliopsis zonata CBS 506.65]OJJ51055.1 hypothetical protein ASPZODRAFT_57313 [Penicilliopsis zonata CBS 506.65]